MLNVLCCDFSQACTALHHTVLYQVISHPCALLTCSGAVIAVVLHTVAGRLDGPGEALAPGPRGGGDPRYRPRQHRAVVAVVVDVDVAAHIPQGAIIVIVNCNKNLKTKELC